MPGTGRWILRSVLLVLLFVLTRTAAAVPGCPFCGPSDPPFSMRKAECQTALLAVWDGLKSDPVQMTEQTTFRVAKVIKEEGREYRAGDKITWDVGRNGKQGDRYVLLGNEIDGQLTWSPIALDGENYIYAYILNAPSPEAPDRLTFFLKFLEFPQTDIANDAYAEFSRAQFKDVAALAAKMPRAKLRQWLASDSPQMRIHLGLYGMMLGLCGDDADADFLEQLILSVPDPDRPRFGIDGMMAGYVMLRGERGLQKLLSAKFDDPRADSDLPLVQNAIVFLWDYCQDRIPADSLRAAMRRMLDRPNWAFGVVEHLARWKDWQSLDQLISRYGKEPFNSDPAKQRIIAFALVCEKDGRATSPNDLPASAIKARKFLNTLDPDFVKSAERLLGLSRRQATDVKSGAAAKRPSD